MEGVLQSVCKIHNLRSKFRTGLGQRAQAEEARPIVDSSAVMQCPTELGQQAAALAAAGFAFLSFAFVAVRADDTRYDDIHNVRNYAYLLPRE